MAPNVTWFERWHDEDEPRDYRRENPRDEEEDAMTMPQWFRKAMDFNSHRQLAADEVTMMVRQWQLMSGLVPDGMYGPKTAASVREQLDELGWRAVEQFALPSNRAQVIAMYGDPTGGRPGTPEPDQEWEDRYIIELHGEDRLPGVPSQWYVKLNRYAEPVIRRALLHAQRAAPDYQIERLGGYVYRGKSSNPSELSLHAYGAAVDIDAPKNRAVRFDPGRKPVPWSARWMEIWPDGLPRAFVEAMKSVGLVWGGDFKSYVDPQHFQAAAPDA